MTEERYLQSIFALHMLSNLLFSLLEPLWSPLEPIFERFEEQGELWRQFRIHMGLFFVSRSGLAGWGFSLCKDLFVSLAIYEIGHRFLLTSKP